MIKPNNTIKFDYSGNTFTVYKSQDGYLATDRHLLVEVRHKIQEQAVEIIKKLWDQIN